MEGKFLKGALLLLLLSYHREKSILISLFYHLYLSYFFIVKIKETGVTQVCNRINWEHTKYLSTPAVFKILRLRLIKYTGAITQKSVQNSTLLYTTNRPCTYSLNLTLLILMLLVIIMAKCA